MSVRVSVDTSRLRNTLRRIDFDLLKAAQRGIKLGILEVEGEAKRLVQKSPGTGRVYQKYNPRRTHTASAPGEPPATDTGYLASHITHAFDQDGMGGGVVSQAEYAGSLEFGSHDGTVAPRPYMTPAANNKRKRVQEIVTHEIQKAARRHRRR